MGLFDNEDLAEMREGEKPNKKIDGFGEENLGMGDDLPSEGGLFSNAGSSAISFDEIGFDDEPKKSGDKVVQENAGGKRWEETLKDIVMSGIDLIKQIIDNIIHSSLDDNIISFRNLAIVCGVLGVVCAVLFITGDGNNIALIRATKYFGLGSVYNVLVGIGAISILMLVSYRPCKMEDVEKMVEMIKEEKEEELDEEIELESAYEKSMDDIMKEILGDDYEENDDIGSSDSEDEEDSDDTFSSGGNSGGGINWDEVEDEEEAVQEVQVNAGGIMNRLSLFNTFKTNFPVNNRDFAKINVIDPDDEKFEQMKLIIMKAIAKEMGKEIKDISGETTLLELKDSSMCIEMKVKQPKKKLKASALEENINNYSNDILSLMCDPKQLYSAENSDNNEVSARVEIDGDYFNIIISKPNKNAILVGDILKDEDVEEFICNSKNIFPVVYGVNELGKPIYGDLKNLFSGMIGGFARSGKSWFVASIISQLVSFNTPEQIQLVLVDPKKTPLFSSMEKLPHTAGLLTGDKPNDAKRVIKMLSDINEKEASRRAEILQEAGCDNIWDYRKQGNTMPLIFIFIDEYMTIKKNAEIMSDNRVNYSKQLDNLLSIMTTRLAYVGIFLFMISHRFTGVVDKDARLLSPFRAVFRADDLMKEVFEKSELSNFTKKLVQAGDMGAKIDGSDVKYIRSLGLTTSDKENNDRFIEIAKAFYRMKATVPDMSSIGIGYTRDNQKIHDELFSEDDDKSYQIEE